MSLNQSPRIVTDGLVYYHDMNNTKSYAGPAIQNLMTGITLQGIGTSTGYVVTGGTEIVDIPQLGPTTTYYTNIQNNYTSFTPNSANCCPSLLGYANGIAVTPSTLYTYGLVYKCDSGYTGPNYMYRYEYTSNGGTYVTEAGVHSTSNRTYLGNGWWWAWGTFTTTATTNWLGYMAAFYYQYSSNTDKLSVAKVLLTPGNYTGLHPKYWPDIATTRATTAVVTDLTKQNAVTATSLSYNSDGTFSFDGINNYMTLPASSTNSLSTSALTTEAWVNHRSFGGASDGRTYWHSFNALGSQNGFILRTFYTHTYPSFWWCYGATNLYNAVYASGMTMSLNTWYHVVGTFQQGVAANIYVNSVLQNSVSGATVSSPLVYDTTNGIFIGYSEINASKMDGNIAIAKIYNRTLSADEILQNFNALRGRFGL